MIVTWLVFCGCSRIQRSKVTLKTLRNRPTWLSWLVATVMTGEFTVLNCVQVYCWHTSNILSLTTREATWYVISVMSVCLSVCQSIAFESLDIWSSYLHIRYICRQYSSCSYVKVTGQVQGHRSQKGRKFLLPQCKTSIGNNSDSIKHRAMKFAYSMGFLTIAAWMVWPPSLSRDQKRPHITKYMHSRVVGLRLEGSLEYFVIDHLQSSTVVMSVYLCLSVCQSNDNFRKPRRP